MRLIGCVSAFEKVRRFLSHKPHNQNSFRSEAVQFIFIIYTDGYLAHRRRKSLFIRKLRIYRK